MSPAKAPIQIRAASETDRAAVLAMMSSAAGEAKAETLRRRWQWQWHQDPRLASPGYQGLIAAWQGRAIASVSAQPAGLYINGSPVDAYWYVDSRIHWGWSRLALRAAAADGWSKRELFPKGLAGALLDHPGFGKIQLGKHIAEPMIKMGYRCGFVDVPGAGNRMRRVSLRAPLEQRLGRFAGRALATLADLSIPLPRRPSARAGLAVTVLDEPFDARFDGLWGQALAAYPSITRRDAQVLNWRYRAHPDTSYRVLQLGRGPRLAGYLVFKVSMRKGRRVARIVDLLCMPDDQTGIRALVTKALSEMREQGAERADWFIAGPGVGEVATSLGFRARLTRSRRPQPLLVRGLASEPYVTSGDGDGG